MSNSAVLDRPTVTEPEEDWVVLDDRSWWSEQVAHEGVQIRGHGADRHGLIPASGITAASPNLVVLPSVDDLDS